MTLTQTAILTRQIIVISGITLILLIAGFIGYNMWRAYYLAHLPPVEEKPDIKFGLLPVPLFPKSSVSTSNYSYSMDTVTGGLPKVGQEGGFEKLIKVYFVTQTFATLLSPDRSTNLAEKFDITTLPQILSETNYRFKEGEKTLLVNLDTGNFSFKNDFPASASAKESPDEDIRLVNDFKNKLEMLGALKDDLKNGRSKVSQLDGKGKFEISLWPQALDKKNIYSPNFNKSSVNAEVLGSASDLDNYQTFDFIYFPVDAGTFATYPLKMPEKAFDDLKSGKGIVIVEPDNPRVSITSVNIGYYMPQDYTPYLQPIYIFEGPSFVAYVSAINEDFQVKATQN